MTSNFENVKVGDFISFYSGGWHGETVIAKVTHVTSKQFSAGHRRFRKSDGAMIGDKYIKCHYATDEDLKRHNELKYRIALEGEVYKYFHSSNAITSLSNSQLEEIIKIIKSDFILHG